MPFSLGNMGRQSWAPVLYICCLVLLLVFMRSFSTKGQRPETGSYYNSGGSYSPGERSEVTWWRVVLIIIAIGVLFSCFLLLYIYRCRGPPVEADERAVNVANYLKQQKELRNGHLPTVDKPLASNGQVSLNGSCLPPPPECPGVSAPLLPPGDSSTPQLPLETTPPLPADLTPSQISIIIPPNGSVNCGTKASTE